MDLSPTSLHPGEPVERFRPTTGQVPGWAGLAVAALVLLDVAVSARSVGGLRVATGAVLGASVIWVTQFRPRVTAYDDALVVHGILLDTLVPYAAVERMTLGQTLNVWAGGRRYVCVGIGRSRSAGRRGPSNLGTARLGAFETSGPPGPTRGEVSYPDFVEERIWDLIGRFRERTSVDAAPQPVRRAWALPPVAALVSAVLLLGLALLL